ncbi:MAG: GNAT family N-acetyltransferase [Rickettsiales bacterium]
MHVTILDNNHREEVNHFLRKDTKFNMFMLSNIKKGGLEYKGKTYQAEYVGMFDSKFNLLGVLSHAWNGIILLQCNNLDYLETLTKYFIQNVKRKINGIIGADEQAEFLRSRLEFLNKEYHANRCEDLFSLKINNLIKPKTSLYKDVKLQPISDMDTKLLYKWCCEYEKEALNIRDKEIINKNVNSFIEQPDLEQNYFVLFHDGQPVSMCGVNARHQNYAQIGGVYTPKEFRNQGFARWAIYLLLQELKKQKIDNVILFTSNPLANRAYTNIGFSCVGVLRLIFFK